MAMPAWRLAIAAVAGLMLAGCSGSPFGEQLSRSFSSSPPTPQPPAPTATPKAPAPPTTPSEPASTTEATPGGAQASKATPSAPSKKPAAKGPAASVTPAPYRVTIKLPSADPSAPAEVVTEALRRAGVPFEVEMIERVQPGSSAASPTVTPAPAPR